MSDLTQSTTLEQTLNKTDFGHVLYENRKVFLAAILAVLLCVTGYVLWKQSRHSSALNNSVDVFEFQSKTWAQAKEGKIQPADLAKAFDGLEEKVQSAPLMVPVVLEMTKFLYDKGAYAEAEAILSKVNGDHKHFVPAYFISMQRAVVLEKLGKLDEAITTLEELSKAKDGLMAAKVSLDLGRLYLTKGEKGKAQTQFESVVSNYPNDEHAKLAKLYLTKLAQ